MSLSISIQKAKQTASDLLAENKFSIPIDIFSVAKKLNIEVRKKEFDQDEVSGLIKRESKNGNPVIIVNENHCEERQRFTIAHEIGHYLLHVNELLHVDLKTDGIYFRDEKSSQANDIREIQANQFAAELLMPTEEIKKELTKMIKSGKEILESITALSKKFKVSTSAMTIKVGSILSQ